MVKRAEEEDGDGKQLNAVHKMEELGIAADGQVGAARVKFDLDLAGAAHDDLPLGPGLKYPEGDYKRQALVPEHCSVQIYTARDAEPATPPVALRTTARRMRRRLEALRADPGRVRGQTEGDDIDLDAWIRYQADQGPRSSTPPVFQRRVRTERSFATVLLADLSLSPAAHVNDTPRVI